MSEEKGFGDFIRDLYGPQIMEQLGSTYDPNAPKSPYKNETKEWESDSCARRVRAIRRQDYDNNAWHVSVTFGDGGAEVDPGVYSESKEKALEEIEIAIQELEEAAVWIRDNLPEGK